jgi:hypothetical protein
VTPGSLPYRAMTSRHMGGVDEREAPWGGHVGAIGAVGTIQEVRQSAEGPGHIVGPVGR